MAIAQGFNLRSVTTPLIIASYLITGVSGVMLFFHFGEALIKEAHEWIGVLFVIGALLHIANHWMPFKRYFAKPLARTVIVSVLAAGSAFMVVSGSESDDNPVKAVMHSIEQAPLSLVAQLQQREEGELVRILENAGMRVTDSEESVQTLAAVNNRSSREVIPLLFRN
jgi:hypothetical protein